MPVDVFECIKTRRSVRAFKADPVPKDVIESLVTAAHWAPTASNRQELVFVAITARQDLQRVKAMAPGITGEPSAAIVVACDRSCLPPTSSGQQITDVVQMDAAMAVQNILLAATSSGLGSCAVHSFRPSAVQRFLCLPEHIVPLLMVALGYPARVPRVPARRPLTDVLHWGRMTAGKTEASVDLAAAEDLAIPATLTPAAATNGASLDGTLLVMYLLSTARGLLQEPLRYGPMRLLDAACRVIEFLDKRGLVEHKVKGIADELVEQRNKGSQGQAELGNVLDSALSKLSTDL